MAELQRWVADRRALFSLLEDGGVVLDLETKRYFVLNATACAAWQLLEGQGRTTAELATVLAERFEVEEEQASSDVQALLLQLASEGLVRSH